MESAPGSTRQQGPKIVIKEQPASKALRFRYECEGRSAGSIPGVNSTSENKTYPTIQIQGYKGRAIIVVSCVTKDAPYKPHPHNLVGRDGCKRGVCTVEINSDNMTQSFDHLGIQCVKKKDIEEALRVRQEIRVDPFITGFQHKSQPGNIDLNAVRLCFQAFLENEPGKFKHALTPAVSDVIYDKKALCDLSICKLSHSSAPVSGGLPIIILCEKVAKEDIQVRFYEEQHNEIVWEGYGDFTPSHVHKQVAISLKTPKYRTIEVDRPVQVKIQLVRPSDKEQSLPLPFQLTPLDSGSYEEVSRKRPKRTSQQVEMDPQMLAIAGISGYGSPRIVKQEPGSSPSHVLLSPAGLHGYPSPSPQDMRSANSSPVYQPLVGNNPNTIYYPSSVAHGVYDSINPQTSPHLDYPQQPGLVFHPVIPEESQVNESSLTNINPTLNLSGVMSIDLDDNLSNLSLSNDPVQSRRGDMSDSFNKYLTTLADFTQ